MTAKKKVDLVRGYPQPNISLNADQLQSMLFDVEWDLAEKTQSLMTLLKNKGYHQEKDWKNIEQIENLLSQRYNIIGAQMLLDDMEKQK